MAGFKILLVDDDVDDLAIITDAIKEQREEAVIVHAENGEAALQLLNDPQENQHQFCLIILDLNMPKMNGTQTLMNLKSDERFRDTPVIIYSTSINPLEKEKCMFLGAHSYITKPTSLKECKETAEFFIESCRDRE